MCILLVFPMLKLSLTWKCVHINFSDYVTFHLATLNAKNASKRRQTNRTNRMKTNLHTREPEMVENKNSSDNIKNYAIQDINYSSINYTECPIKVYGFGWLHGFEFNFMIKL